jgi:lipopolysaccharide transport protein LptA
MNFYYPVKKHKINHQNSKIIKYFRILPKIFLTILITIQIISTNIILASNSNANNDKNSSNIKKTTNKNINKKRGGNSLGASKKNPVKITAEKFYIDRKNNKIDFIGNVIVEQEKSIITSSKMTVIIDEKDSKNKIKKIFSNNKIKIFNDNTVATGNRGYYDPISKDFTLEGEVIVNSGTSIAKGEKFIYNLNSKQGLFVANKIQNKSVENNSQNDQPDIKDGNNKIRKDDDGRVVLIIGDDIKENENFK